MGYTYGYSINSPSAFGPFGFRARILLLGIWYDYYSWDDDDTWNFSA